MTYKENCDKVYSFVKSICNNYGYSIENLFDDKYQITGSFFSIYFYIDFCNENSIVWERLEFDSFTDVNNLEEHINDFKNQIFSFMKEVESGLTIKPF